MDGAGLDSSLLDPLHCWSAKDHNATAQPISGLLRPVAVKLEPLQSSVALRSARFPLAIPGSCSSQDA